MNRFYCVPPLTMGCGGSKGVEVRIQNPGTSSHHETNTNLQEVEINVFTDSINNNNELGGSCYNAKPRLRSAIHRGENADIKPVDSIENNALEQHTFGGTSSNLEIESDSHFNVDSGFDTNRANSETSVRAKSLLDVDGRQSHNSSVIIRSDSGANGSVITARDLNASFITSDDCYAPANADVTFELGTPFGELTDLEHSHNRTQSNTPSRLATSAGQTPITMHPKNIDVIKEESEGGFTPRSAFDMDGINGVLVHPIIELQTKCPQIHLQKYTPDEVRRHNQTVGWCEWGVYKNKVYDTNKVINTLSPLSDEYVRSRNVTDDEKNDLDFDVDEIKDDVKSDYDANECLENECITEFPRSPIRLTRPLIYFIMDLRLHVGISMNVIQQNLAKCVLGVLWGEKSREFWDTFRKDLDTVLHDLIRDDLHGEISQNTRDIMEQMQRWMLTYRYENPQSVTETVQPGNLNDTAFVLPIWVQDHPECLRRWVERWEQFDFDIPESGAWPSYEVEYITLGDPDELFISTLRSHVNFRNQPDTTVDGEAAWDVIQEGIFQNDIMTEEQLKTEENRRHRTDLHDPQRMKNRRDCLLRYFVRKYYMDEHKVKHFLNWAHSMDQGERRFQALCSGTSTGNACVGIL